MDPTIAAFRRLLLGVLVLGLVGTLTELLLLAHWDGWRQWLPLVLLGAGVVAVSAVGIAPSRATVWSLRSVMMVSLVVGAIGVWFHYRGNVEFEVEMSPEVAGWRLFAEAMTGATPALAPGAMAWIGLLGLLVTWRHPAARTTLSIEE